MKTNTDRRSARIIINNNVKKVNFLNDCGIECRTEYGKLIAYKSSIDFINVFGSSLDQLKKWVRC